MPNSATQNPANKVGRNSGAGAGGVSEVVPTEAEARRGVEPIHRQSTYTPDSGGGIGRLGIVALLGAGVAALVTRRIRRPKSRVDQIRDYVGSKAGGFGRKSRTDRVLGRLKVWE